MKSRGVEIDRYYDMLHGDTEKPENRTAEEIIEDTCSKAGITII